MARRGGFSVGRSKTVKIAFTFSEEVKERLRRAGKRGPATVNSRG
jgi:hypothetical protein